MPSAGAVPLAESRALCHLAALGKSGGLAFSTPDLHPGVGVTLLPGPVFADGDGVNHPVGYTGADTHIADRPDVVKRR